MRNQNEDKSRLSAGEPPSTACANTELAFWAMESPQLSKMHLGVFRSTMPAHIISSGSSSEPSSEGVTEKATLAPSRKTLSSTLLVLPLGTGIATAAAGLRF